MPYLCKISFSSLRIISQITSMLSCICMTINSCPYLIRKLHNRKFKLMNVFCFYFHFLHPFIYQPIYIAVYLSIYIYSRYISMLSISYWGRKSCAMHNALRFIIESWPSRICWVVSVAGSSKMGNLGVIQLVRIFSIMSWH